MPEPRVAVSSEVPPCFFWLCGTEVISHRRGERAWKCPEAGSPEACCNVRAFYSVSIVSMIPLTFLCSVHMSLHSSCQRSHWDRRKWMGTLFPNQFVPWKGLPLFLLPYHPVSCVLPKGGWDEGSYGAGHHINGMHTYFRAPYIQSAASGTLGDTEIKKGAHNESNQAFTHAILFTPLTSLI